MGKTARKCCVTGLLQANLHLIYTYVSCQFTDIPPRLAFVMIANIRPLHLVPHAGSAMPLQSSQHGVTDNLYRESRSTMSKTKPVRTPDCVVVCLAYASERGEIAPVKPLELRGPGLVLMATYDKPKELRMPRYTSQPSDSIKPSFAENLFQLLLLM
jgi:hypothetical protein